MKNPFAILSLCTAVLIGSPVFSAETQTTDTQPKAEFKPGDVIPLPQVRMDNPATFMTVLKDRKTSRQFSNQALTLQQLGDLFWCANGISRPDGKRTAPSAMNRQEINLYAITAKGVYGYTPKTHTLTFIEKGDFTKEAGGAPVTIVLTADEKIQPREYALVDAGFVGQNIYLYCAANNLVTVFRGQINRDAVKKILKLPETEQVLFGQTVGYPPNEKTAEVNRQ